MDVLLNELEDQSVPQPAGWIDISGTHLLNLLEALRILAGACRACGLVAHRVLRAGGELNESVLPVMARKLGVRFRKLHCANGRVERGEMFVRIFNRRHGPWYWRPGIAELAVLWLQKNPDDVTFESDWVWQLSREAARQQSFCCADIFELRSGSPATVHEDHLRALLFALYWACPHKGALPELKFLLSPHAGDFYHFAQTLGVQIDGPSLEVDPGEETGEPAAVRPPLAAGYVTLYAGLYDFRYSPSGLSRPLSHCVLAELLRRIANGDERPWDMTELMQRLEDEGEQMQRRVTASLLYGNRIVGALTIAAGLVGPPVPSAAAAIAPIHVVAHAVLEIAAAAGQRRRKDGETDEDSEQDREERARERKKGSA